MLLEQWANRWGVSKEALDDFRRMVGIEATTRKSKKQSEAAVQALVRAEASRKGLRLWRNNIGAVHTVDGRFIRFGLANDSKQINSVIKSHDLIGIRPLLITHEHVGKTVGVFTSRECKPTHWRFSPNDKHAAAQLKWAILILSLGGDACFATGEGTL